jgi:hypothetical protein
MVTETAIRPVEWLGVLDAVQESISKALAVSSSESEAWSTRIDDISRLVESGSTGFTPAIIFETYGSGFVSRHFVVARIGGTRVRLHFVREERSTIEAAEELPSVEVEILRPVDIDLLDRTSRRRPTFVEVIPEYEEEG